jgi:hypothetical protein
MATNWPMVGLLLLGPHLLTGFSAWIARRVLWASMIVLVAACVIALVSISDVSSSWGSHATDDPSLLSGLRYGAGLTLMAKTFIEYLLAIASFVAGFLGVVSRQQATWPVGEQHVENPSVQVRESNTDFSKLPRFPAGGLDSNR